MTDASTPKVGKPRMFGGHLEPKPLPWAWAAGQLDRAFNYWIATTRPDGRPHTRPVWGLWLDGAFWFTTGSLAAGNLAQQSAITVHLESGNESVIIEGVAEQVTDSTLLETFKHAYGVKYHGWEIDPGDPTYCVQPQVAFGWFADGSGLDNGALFNSTATRWTFD